jgi:hypothetical protein
MSNRRFTGSSAWEQMIGQQMSLLAKFDEAKRQARGHEVQTYHGRVAEASFRDWLGNFLPKRFGVTSGYVVSQQPHGEVQFPHFDVIIYDQLEAPILWIEDNADLSERGKSRAIPVEYARGILEVKATFGSGEAKDAMEHLRDLAPFYAAVDPEGERYKQYLRADFFSAVVFFDATSEAMTSKAATDHLKPINGPRGFYGGTILRGGHQPAGTSGTLRVLKEITDLGLVWECHLLWGESCFSRFGFDLVAMLNGTYHPGMISSMHVGPPLKYPLLKPNIDGVIDIKDHI